MTTSREAARVQLDRNDKHVRGDGKWKKKASRILCDGFQGTVDLAFTREPLDRESRSDITIIMSKSQKFEVLGDYLTFF